MARSIGSHGGQRSPDPATNPLLLAALDRGLPRELLMVPLHPANSRIPSKSHFRSNSFKHKDGTPSGVRTPCSARIPPPRPQDPFPRRCAAAPPSPAPSRTPNPPLCAKTHLCPGKRRGLKSLAQDQGGAGNSETQPEDLAKKHLGQNPLAGPVQDLEPPKK